MRALLFVGINGLILAGAALLAPAVRADVTPLIVPTRDVDVTYQMTGRDNAGNVVTLPERIRWAPGQGLMRVDPPTHGMYVVAETKAHHLSIIRPDERVVLLMESDATDLAPGLAHAQHFEQAGAATVAGLSCTEWHTTDSGGQPATVCLTADGVLLQARNDTRVLVQASSVTYGPLDPAVFRIPADFRTIRPPR